MAGGKREVRNPRAWRRWLWGVVGAAGAVALVAAALAFYGGWEWWFVPPEPVAAGAETSVPVPLERVEPLALADWVEMSEYEGAADGGAVFEAAPTPVWLGQMPATQPPPPTVAFLATPTPTPVPPTPTPELPVALPTVSAVDARLLGMADDALATPTPAPYLGKVAGTDIVVRRQTVFLSQVSRPPDFWPNSENVFYQRTARHIGWMIDLDYSAEDPDFEMTGLVRWLNVTSGEHVIYQQPYVMDADHEGNALLFMLGKDAPGFWHAGRYRLELWDNRDRVVAHYDFTVKLGVAR